MYGFIETIREWFSAKEKQYYLSGEPQTVNAFINDYMTDIDPMFEMPEHIYLGMIASYKVHIFNQSGEERQINIEDKVALIRIYHALHELGNPNSRLHFFNHILNNWHKINFPKKPFGTEIYASEILENINIIKSILT